ncbi:hypothetical protein KBG31_00910 [Patescibacteria group bacterium]|nr:hypothetical protein [Patescibacteria group bacterium]HOM77930.1 hypothetical protein [bacterium]
MEDIADIIRQKNVKSDPRNKHEYQAYGNRLSEEFADPKHRALYIKLAKDEDRNLLEQAREYVMRSERATTKGKLFMWKLTELRKAKEAKSDKDQDN